MSSVSSQLDHVVDKTSKLIDLCLSLQEENDLLKLENQSVKVAFEASKNKTKDLEDQLKVLAVARSLEGNAKLNEGTKSNAIEIKQKINDFVREIDRCIELLK